MKTNGQIKEILIMKKNKFLSITTCLLLIFFYSCNFKSNQSTIRTCNNHCKDSNIVADSLFRHGNLNEAIKQYQISYRKCNNKVTAYSLAYCYAIIQRTDSSFYYLQNAIKCDSSIYKLFDGKLYNIITDKRWSSIVIPFTNIN